MADGESGMGIIGSVLLGWLIAFLAILGLQAHEDAKVRRLAKAQGISEDEARTAVLAHNFQRIDEMHTAKRGMLQAAREFFLSFSPWHQVPMRPMGFREMRQAQREGRLQAEIDARLNEVSAEREARRAGKLKGK